MHHRVPDLQRGAVLRKGGAEEGSDGVEDHVDDVFLQDGIRKTLLSFITNLQVTKNIETSINQSIINQSNTRM